MSMGVWRQLSVLLRLFLARCGKAFSDHGWGGALMEEAQAAYVEQQASTRQSALASESEPLLRQSLPNCSVLFFHHLETTAGTTLRAVMQRQAQLG
eukprot:1542763-Prymnesium_polylepis.1